MLSLQLPDDGAHAAIKHTYHGVEAMALLLQAGQGDAVFGLELGVGSRARQPDRTSSAWVLRFKFESACTGVRLCRAHRAWHSGDGTAFDDSVLKENRC